MKIGDVLIDPQGEIYVIVNIGIKMRRVLLQHKSRCFKSKDDFFGLVFRRRDYVAESFTKIGEL